MFKVFLGLTLGVLFTLIYTQTRLIISHDLSTLPVDLAANPDYQRTKDFSRPPVYLVSYADGPEIFFKNQHALAASALNRGIDFILNYRRSHLDPAFVQENQAILDQKPGAGFWLWKPWVIAHALKHAPENAIIIYADTGFVFQRSVRPWIEKLGPHDILLIAYDSAIDGAPIEMTKRDVFVKLNCDEQMCWQGTHVWAGLLVLRNTPKARSFIDQWLKLCCDPVLLTDVPGHYPPHPRQNRHQHDEAILSALYNKTSSSFITLLPVAELRQIAFWHHRHPGKEYESLWHKSTPNLRGVERDWVLNAPWMKKLRAWLSAK